MHIRPSADDRGFAVEHVRTKIGPVFVRKEVPVPPTAMQFSRGRPISLAMIFVGEFRIHHIFYTQTKFVGNFLCYFDS